MGDVWALSSPTEIGSRFLSLLWAALARRPERPGVVAAPRLPLSLGQLQSEHCHTDGSPRQADRQTDREGCSRAPWDCHQVMLLGTDSFSLSGHTGQRGMQPWGWHSRGQRPGLLGTAPARAAPATALSRRETAGRACVRLRKCLKKICRKIWATQSEERGTLGPLAVWAVEGGCCSGEGWELIDDSHSRENAPNPPSNPLSWKRLSVSTGGHKQHLSGTADHPNIYTRGKSWRIFLGVSFLQRTETRFCCVDLLSWEVYVHWGPGSKMLQVCPAQVCQAVSLVPLASPLCANQQSC